MDWISIVCFLYKTKTIWSFFEHFDQETNNLSIVERIFATIDNDKIEIYDYW